MNRKNLVQNLPNLDGKPRNGGDNASETEMQKRAHVLHKVHARWMELAGMC